MIYLITGTLQTSRLKAKFIPEDYELELFKKLQNLKQNDVCEGLHWRIFKIQIKYGHFESSKEKVARYVNVLKFNVHDELSMLKFSSIEDYLSICIKGRW